VQVQSADELVESLRSRCRALCEENARLRANHRAVEKYYSVQEVALLLSFSERWVRDQVQSGRLDRVVRIGRDVRVPASAINALLEMHSGRPRMVGIPARSVGELRRKLGHG
jgi:excisionase family DNA binding protein